MVSIGSETMLRESATWSASDVEPIRAIPRNGWRPAAKSAIRSTNWAARCGEPARGREHQESREPGEEAAQGWAEEIGVEWPGRGAVRMRTSRSAIASGGPAGRQPHLGIASVLSGRPTIGSDLLANRKEPKERSLCCGSSDRNRNTHHSWTETELEIGSHAPRSC